MLIPEYSSLRTPPENLTRRQVLFLDGIRYAVEMAHIAYSRLYDLLQLIAVSPTQPLSDDITRAMLDAWSVIDSAHRMRDLVAGMPGLPHSVWTRLLQERTSDIDELRNAVQHQRGEVDGLAEYGGQLWGYLSWAAVRDGQHTGKWLMLTAGTYYAGDEWLFGGPVQLPFRVPNGRIGLNAFGKRVYLGRTVEALIEAAKQLERDLDDGKIRAVGQPGPKRTGVDMVVQSVIYVVTGPAEGSQNA